jgi:hypothetical protein
MARAGSPHYIREKSPRRVAASTTTMRRASWSCELPVIPLADAA